VRPPNREAELHPILRFRLPVGLTEMSRTRIKSRRKVAFSIQRGNPQRVIRGHTERRMQMYIGGGVIALIIIILLLIYLL
jgi:hypothetical protein